MGEETVTASRVVTIDDQPTLTRGFADDPVAAQLESSSPLARFDAALLLTFMHRPRWADAIDALAAEPATRSCFSNVYAVCGRGERRPELGCLRRGTLPRPVIHRKSVGK